MQRASVALVLPICPTNTGVGPVDGEQVARILRAELSGDGVTDVSVIRAADSELGLARVTFVAEQCVLDASSLTVQVDDAVTRKHVERTVDLSDVSGAIRTRTLALAVAELLRASWAELELPEVPESAVLVPETLRAAMRTRLAEPRERAIGSANYQANVGTSLVAIVAPPALRVPNETAVWWLGVALMGVNERPGRGGVRLSLDRVSLQTRTWSWWIRGELGTDVGVVDDRLGTLLTGTATVGISGGLSSNPRSAVSVLLGIRSAGGLSWGQGIFTQINVVSTRGLGPYVALGAMGAVRARIAQRVTALVELDAHAVLATTELTAGIRDNADAVIRDERVLTGGLGVGFGASFGLAWQL